MDKLVVFVAKGPSDIHKWMRIAQTVGAKVAGCSFLIVTSTSEAITADAAGIRVVNVYAGLDSAMNAEASELAARALRLADYVKVDAYRADERFIYDAAPERELLIEQCHVAEALLEIFGERRPDFLFSAGAGTLLRTVAISVGKNMGIPSYRILGAHHMNPGRQGRRYFFCDNDYGELPEAEALFDHDPAALDRFVDRFVNALIDKSYRFDSYSRTAGRAWRVSGSLREAAIDVVRMLRAAVLGNKLSAVKLRYRLIYFLRGITQRPLFRAAPKTDKPYVVFPLNISDDAQLRLRAKHLSDTEAVIRMAASNLPWNVRLAVKPHPGNPGMLKTGVIKRLKREFPDLTFIHPNVPLTPLVQKSEGVLVINGSIALEAALIRKPCFHLGRYFLSGLPNCIRIDSFRDFASLVAGAAQKIPPDCMGPARALLKRYYGYTYPLVTQSPDEHDTIEDTIAAGLVRMLA